MRIYRRGMRGWNLKRFATSSARVPAAPGVYVLSELRTFEGLPTSLRHIYVGKSQNLRRRLDQHTMQTEVHRELREFMERCHDDLWIWYTTDLSSRGLSELEVIMIQDLSPRFNTVHKRQPEG